MTRLSTDVVWPYNTLSIFHSDNRARVATWEVQRHHIILSPSYTVKQSHYSPGLTLTVFQKVEATRFKDSRHVKVVRLSALRTGRLYPGKYSWCSFLLEAESTPGS